MTTYAYVAFDSTGKSFQGSVQEKSWTQALRRVKEMGLFPASLKEKPSPAPSQKVRRILKPVAVLRKAGRSPFLARSVPTRVLTGFTRQMATLLDAGIPILRALRCIEEQEENRTLRGILREVGREIEGGSTFSEALARHPGVFDRLYINMVIAGEAAGMLEHTLSRLADCLERSQRIRSKIVSALFYPSAVLIVAAGILLILAVFVIPKFKEVLGELTGTNSLPAFTQYVLGSADFIKDHLLHLLGGLVAVITGFNLLRATEMGRLALDRLKLRLPIAGRITRKAAIARFARTLGTMLANGVPVLQALKIGRETIGNALFAEAIQKTHEMVKEGESLTAPLRNSALFPSMVVSMIDVGEQTGALPTMLLKVADTYEDEVDNGIASALSLLEPLIIILLAIVVGSIVVALFLPLRDIMTGSGGSPAAGAVE